MPIPPPRPTIHQQTKLVSKRSTNHIPIEQTPLAGPRRTPTTAQSQCRPNTTLHPRVRQAANTSCSGARSSVGQRSERAVYVDGTSPSRQSNAHSNWTTTAPHLLLTFPGVVVSADVFEGARVCGIGVLWSRVGVGCRILLTGQAPFCICIEPAEF
jgi:hypothetical protein